jgi:hypothetical protein
MRETIFPGRRVRGILRKTSTSSGRGVLLHPMLAVDAENGSCLDRETLVDGALSLLCIPGLMVAMATGRDDGARTFPARS